MIEKIITAVTDLPAIIQGALGSALFALFLFLVRYIYDWLSDIFSKISQKQRLRKLIELEMKLLMTFSDNEEERIRSFQFLIVRALRAFIVAFMWFVFSFFLSNISIIMAIPAIVVCSGYIYSAYDTTKGNFRKTVNMYKPLEKLDEIRSEIHELKIGLKM